VRPQCAAPARHRLRPYVNRPSPSPPPAVERQLRGAEASASHAGSSASANARREYSMFTQAPPVFRGELRRYAVNGCSFSTRCQREQLCSSVRTEDVSRRIP